VKTLALFLIIALLPVLALGQKTVRVREYRRKDGTVVRTHTRRAPRRSGRNTPVATTTPTMSEKPFKPSKSDLRAELWHRLHLQQSVNGARSRLRTVQADLDLYLSLPTEKRIPEPYYSQIIQEQQALVDRSTAALQVAEKELSAFDKAMADNDLRAAFHRERKEH
jgi:hypothetical protein